MNSDIMIIFKNENIVKPSDKDTLKRMISGLPNRRTVTADTESFVFNPSMQTDLATIKTDLDTDDIA